MSSRISPAQGFSSRRAAVTFFRSFLMVPSLASAAAEGDPLAVQRQVDTALHSVLLVAGVLVVLILAAVAVIVYRKAFTAPPPEAAAPAADPLAEAAAEENRGNFISAAGRYAAGGDKLKAAGCWEKVKDSARAAECWEAAGDLDRAAQAHLRSGSALRAAGIYMRMKNYIEAAKIFRNKGDHLRAAQALELYGNKLAASREYAVAGNHAHAARLLEGERLYTEAAEAYKPLLGAGDVTAANANVFSTYAALLVLAGDRPGAAMTYRRVLDAVPGHLRAQSALQNLQHLSPGGGAPQAAAPPQVHITPEEAEYEFLEPEPPEAAEMPAAPQALAPPWSPSPPASALAGEIESDAAFDQGDPLKRVFTLRSMIHAGRMEPRYSMRLWVQVMRVLAERHRANVIFGFLTPECIVIDMENNVSIGNPAGRPPEYLAPEVRAGRTPDRQADIYSMGVILFELVCGSLEQYGKKRAGDLHPDVPPWLDELIEHCTAGDPAGRYRTTEEVSAALLRLKNAAQE